MKLQYQLNIAFTTLLVVILSVTGITVYSLLLNLLIQDEQRQLEDKGELLVKVLTERFPNPNHIDQMNDVLKEQDLQLLVYDGLQHNLLFSSLPRPVVEGFNEQNYFQKNERNLWEFDKNKYVISRILIYPQNELELILLTPLTDLPIVQRDFITRLPIVFIVGAGIAALLSYFLTKKLVTPLSQLKRQLKKIEKRQFNNIEVVKASGEMKEVAKSVYDMARELEQYMTSQQTFFQNASHELKTPLMTIQGYAEGIRDDVFSDEERDKGYEVMVKEVSRLKKIINEMILLAKLDSEQSEYNPEYVRIGKVIEQVIDRTLPLATDHHVEIQSHIDQTIKLYIDEEKFMRALLNVVTNGIRYSQSIVNITVQKDKQVIRINIEDDGEGVPEHMLPYIFHRFVKGKHGDTGLGLAISRAIVQQSHGNITVQTSSTLGGAKFVLTFPSNEL